MIYPKRSGDQSSAITRKTNTDILQGRPCGASEYRASDGGCYVCDNVVCGQ